MKKIRWFMILFLALPLMVFCRNSSATQYVNVCADSAEAYFIDDDAGYHRWFVEDAHYNSLTLLGCGSNPWLSASMKYKGTHSLALKIAASGVNPPNAADKCECTFVRNVDPFCLTFGQTRYFGFAMRLGGDGGSPFDTPTQWLLVSQIWQECTSEQPPVALYIIPNSNPLKYRIKVRWEDHIGNYSADNGLTVHEGEINKYTWYNVVFRLVPSHTADSVDGQVALWINGTLIFNYIGDWGYIPQSQGGIAGMTSNILCKAGLYRRRQDTTQVMFVDQIKYGTTYAEVDPSVED